MEYEPPIDNSIIKSDVSVVEAINLNPDDYRADLAEFDLSEEQQNELLQALWNIMAICVDIGWGVDTLHYVCPELFENIASSRATLPPDSLNDRTIAIDTAQRNNEGDQG